MDISCAYNTQKSNLPTTYPPPTHPRYISSRGLFTIFNMETPRTPTDPLTVVRSLDAKAIRKRIDDLDAERQALMVLLRAAQRMEREELRKGERQA
jgi:hypothetical protein